MKCLFFYLFNRFLFLSRHFFFSDSFVDGSRRTTTIEMLTDKFLKIKSAAVDVEESKLSITESFAVAKSFNLILTIVEWQHERKNRKYDVDQNINFSFIIEKLTENKCKKKRRCFRDERLRKTHSRKTSLK